MPGRMLHYRTVFLKLDSANGCQVFRETNMRNGGRFLLAVINLYVRICGGISMYFLTHSIHTHTHNYMCTQHQFSEYLHWLYRPLACCCTEIASHADSLQLPRNLQLLSVLIRLRCMDDKLPWLRGWSSARCSPQIQIRVATFDAHHSVADSTQTINRWSSSEASWFCIKVSQQSFAIDRINVFG